MTKQRKWIGHAVTLAAACGLALTVSATAQAVAILHIDDGGANSINIIDADGDGRISYSAAGFGAWSFTMSTGFTKPANGSAGSPRMHLDVLGQSNGGGILNIAFTDTDFLGSGLTKFLTEVAGIVDRDAAGSTVRLESSLTEDVVDVLANLGPYGPGGFSGAQTDSHLFCEAEGYLLSLFGHLTHTSSAVSSFNADIRGTVPEPATLALLGVALLLSGLFARKHRGWRN